MCLIMYNVLHITLFLCMYSRMWHHSHNIIYVWHHPMNVTSSSSSSSPSSSSAGETFGFNHVEASSHGLPVIAFDMMANRESITTGVFIEYERDRLIITLADAMVETYLHLHRHMSVEERASSVMKTCASAKSMYRHWNSRQHSLALISLLDEIIITE